MVRKRDVLQRRAGFSNPQNPLRRSAVLANLLDSERWSFYPLDAGIGLTGDGLSPLVMSLGTRLATRVSFAASVRLFRCFCGWAPSSDTIQQLVLGMGKDSVAYMDQAPVPPDDGEILVIEVDGKATPTATEAELKKRRGKRPQKPHTCRCARHRGQAKRACRGKKKRRKLGDKSKNGRSITLVVMYTLKQGDDGRLHGPINKRVWGSYAPRKVMLAWAREQATKRGFAPATAKRIHLVVDGEICLYDGLSTLFPQATFALDIRHVEERLWKVGRALYSPDHALVEQWVEDQRERLYSGRALELVTGLKAVKLTLSARAKRDADKRDALSALIGYLDKRLSMMAYKDLIDEDRVIASGIVEGARAMEWGSGSTVVACGGYPREPKSCCIFAVSSSTGIGSGSLHGATNAGWIKCKPVSES